jgi:hypothetical protein
MIRKLLLLSALVGAIALAAVWASPRDSEANTFNPFYGPSDFYSLIPTTPGANPNTEAQFNVPPNGANFSGLFGRSIAFGDPAVTVAGGAAVPGVGAYMGQLVAGPRLGLLNGGCDNEGIVTTFNFVDAEVDTSAVPFSGGGMVSSGAIAAAADDAVTVMSYLHAGGAAVDPLGLRQNTDGTPVEGTIAAGVNEIEIEAEQMLVVSVDTAANTYGIVRGWNGTTPAAHAAGLAVERVKVIYPNGPGTNLLANLAEDDGDADDNTVPEAAANQVADGADLVPSFVRNSLIPSGNPDDATAVPAHARYVGVDFVAGSLIVILQFVIMSPGALATFPNLSWATAAWGYPSVTFLQDPIAAPSDSAITDFCNFQSNTVLLGTTHDNACTGAGAPAACAPAAGIFVLQLALDGGCPGGGSGPPNECGSIRATNPVAVGSVRYYNYNVSQRDYDDDGHDNALDTCSFNPNPGWDPRVANILSGGDAEGDGLPTACDPNESVVVVAEAGAACGANTVDDDGDGFVNDGCPAVGAPELGPACDNAIDDPPIDGAVNDGCPATSGDNSDQDRDGAGVGWLNRLDNCPRVPNVAPVMSTPNDDQFDQDTAPGVTVYDGGPNTDSIGPECDIAGNSCGGCPTLTPTGANGHYHSSFAAQTICITALAADDDDSDGVCDAQEAPAPACTGGLSGVLDTDCDDDGVVDGRDTCYGRTNPPLTFTGAEPASSTLTAAEAAGSTVLDVADTTGFTLGSVVIRTPLETLRYITAVGATTVTVTPALTSAHAIGAAVEQVKFAQPAFDYDNSGAVDIINDHGKVSAAAFKIGGNPAQPPGYDARFDFNNNGNIGVIDDLGTHANAVFKTCGPP